MSLVKNKESFDTKTWICAILLFIISFPKFVWGMGMDVMLFAQLLLFFICFNDIRDCKKNFVSIASFCLQIVFVCVYYTVESTNFNGWLMSFIKGFSYITIFLCPPRFWRSCIDCFIRLLALLLVFALIEHMLIVFFDGNLPSTSIGDCPINTGRPYISYYFNIYHEAIINLHFSRFYAFYDEPGVLGNIAMVLLYLQKFDLKKWYNIVLLISGLLTFSLAFYIAICAFYLISEGSIKTKIVFVIVCAVLIFLTVGNEYIYDYVFKRIEFVDGTLAGYNREKEAFDVFFEKIRLQDYLFIGYSPRSQIEYAASWKWAFVLYGIIPSILYFWATQLSNWRSLPHKEDMIKAIILAVIIWIQRPFIHLYLYSLLFVIPSIYYLTCEEDSNKDRV